MQVSGLKIMGLNTSNFAKFLHDFDNAITFGVTLRDDSAEKVNSEHKTCKHRSENVSS